MMKRISALFLALTLGLGLAGTTLAADNPFTDVSADQFYYDAVLWAYESGVTTGTTATTFSPGATCTRGQVVTFLWRALGKPAPKTRSNPFTDVKSGDYFYEPVLWAVEQGVTTGTTATTFSPEEPCTSAQVITFLWRAMGKPAASASGTVAANYPDAMYYKTPVAWADGSGLFAPSGKAFHPDTASPRADIVTYLYLCVGQATDLGTVRISYNGDVYTSRAWLGKDGAVWLPAAAVTALTGKTPATVKMGGMDCADLSALVDFCIYDEPLGSVYVWDGLPEVEEPADEIKAAFGTISDDPITYKEFFALLDKAVELADSSKLAAWKAQLTEERASDRAMTRLEGMTALFYAAATLGGEWLEFNTEWQTVDDAIGSKIWDELEPAWEVFGLPNGPYELGGFEKAPYVDSSWSIVSVAYRYAYGRMSLASEKILFDFDWTNMTMRPLDEMTVQEGALALSRLLDSKEGTQQLVSLTDAAATHYNTAIISDELLNWAASMPSVGEDFQFQGAVLGGDYNSRTIDLAEARYYARKLSEYGFNTLRYMITYQTFFDQRVTQVDVSALEKLDTVIAYAMRYNIHLDLISFSIPGRWAGIDHETYTSTGEFDLFTNPQRQKEAAAMWQLLATRYKDLPSSVLSFQPIWEPMNTSLSTGLEDQVPAYTGQQAGKVYADLVKTIHAVDPDRLILFEPSSLTDDVWDEIGPITDAMEGLDHVMLLANFAGEDYIYAEMTWETGQHVDFNNHGMFKPAYPVTIYQAQHYIDNNKPLVLKGDLPAGTRIDLYLESSSAGTIKVLADGKDIYTEKVSKKDYTVGSPISGRYPYAQSDKKITFTLPADAKEIRFESSQWQSWCGMDVVLPDEYAVEKWYYPSRYDAFLAGEATPAWPNQQMTSTIQVCPGWGAAVGPVDIDVTTLTYTTDYVAGECTPETIDEWGRRMQEYRPQGSAIRIECAGFNIGTDIWSAAQYYDDILSMCEKYGLGWFVNDYNSEIALGRTDSTFASGSYYAGSVYEPVADGWALLPFVQVHLKHLPATPLPQ